MIWTWPGKSLYSFKLIIKIISLLSFINTEYCWDCLRNGLELIELIIYKFITYIHTSFVMIQFLLHWLYKRMDFWTGLLTDPLVMTWPWLGLCHFDGEFCDHIKIELKWIAFSALHWTVKKYYIINKNYILNEISIYIIEVLQKVYDLEENHTVLPSVYCICMKIYLLFQIQ